MENGKIVEGLAGVPDEGPVLLVGNHMLLGMDLSSLCEAFLREKKILVRGVAHPELFRGNFKELSNVSNFFDIMKVMGAMPVSPKSLLKALSTNSHVLLYPGGAREALHRKVRLRFRLYPMEPSLNLQSSCKHIFDSVSTVDIENSRILGKIFATINVFVIAG